jgi:hypothetical protein
VSSRSEGQLKGLEYLEGSEPTAGNGAYADPARRIGEWISENSGDIIVLANMVKDDGFGYYFDEGSKQSTHGSLTYGDAIVPLAFSYPGATSEDDEVDTVLRDVGRYLRSLAPAGDLAFSPVEREAMERALALSALPEGESEP